jgi:hypothetical protein
MRISTGLIKTAPRPPEPETSSVRNGQAIRTTVKTTNSATTAAARLAWIDMLRRSCAGRQRPAGGSGDDGLNRRETQETSAPDKTPATSARPSIITGRTDDPPTRRLIARRVNSPPASAPSSQIPFDLLDMIGPRFIAARLAAELIVWTANRRGPQ